MKSASRSFFNLSPAAKTSFGCFSYPAVGLPFFMMAKVSLLADGKMGASQGRADRIRIAMQYQEAIP